MKCTMSVRCPPIWRCRLLGWGIPAYCRN